MKNIHPSQPTRPTNQEGERVVSGEETPLLLIFLNKVFYKKIFRIRMGLVTIIYSILLCIILLPSAFLNGQTTPSEEGQKDNNQSGIGQHAIADAGLGRAQASAPDEPFEEFFAENLDVTQRYEEEVDENGEEEHVHGFIKNGTAKMDGEKSSIAASGGRNETTTHMEGIMLDAAVNGNANDELATKKTTEASAADDPVAQSQQEGVVPQQLCAASVEMPTFLRHQWMAGIQQSGMTAANFVRKMDSLEACARLCRENVEPFGGRHFGCHGFTYLSHKNSKNNICEFFDDHLAAAIEKKPPVGLQNGEGHLMEPSGSSKNYFERICLPLSSRCSRFPFAFEVYPRRSFVGIEPIQSEEVDDRKRCLEFCLQNERCRSVDFDTENLTCHLYANTQHWILGANDEKALVGALVESVDLDHYENTCLMNLDRCGSRHLAFVLVRNGELPGFSVGLGKLSISVCLTRCLDSPPAFCRSVQFRPSTSECFLGTERPLSPIPSDEMDIFEPICLPDPPSTSTLECLGENVFERIPNMELREEAEKADGTDIPGLLLEECLDACILDETCQSLNYHASLATEEEEDGELPSQCRLFTFNRADNRTLAVLIQHVDYYELACNRIFYNTNNANNSSVTKPQLEVAPKNVRKEEKKKKGQKEQERISLESVVSSVSGNAKTATATKATTTTVEDQNGNNNTTTLGPTTFPTIWTTSIPIRPPQNCTTTKTGSLLEKGRVLRIEYRLQHHVNVRSLEQCQRICVQAKAFHCAVFAYSQKNRDCLLSSTILANNGTSEYAQKTQKNPTFELYAVKEATKCVDLAINKGGTGNETSGTGKSSTKIITTKTTTETETRGDVERVPSTNPPPSTTTTRVAETTTNGDISTTMARSSTIERISIEEGNSSKGTSTASPSPSIPTESVVVETMAPQKGRPLSPHQVHAAAFCDSQGMNVTFRLIDGSLYSGAVYAADRFSQCRLFVDGQNEFAFFVNRPGRYQQNWCNVQEIDGQMSVMLVVSNDVGVPLEVTTKDDLFFYISCNSANAGLGPIHGEGIVVSGLGIGTELNRLQQHVAQMEQQQQEERRKAGGGGGAQQNEDKRVKLKIARNGQPVSNVYIGEQLMAIVESANLDAGTFRVAECNATRVLLSGDSPQKSPSAGSIPLLDHRGCSLLPQIMGNVRRVGDHLEAPLTAFRIDGSNELDIICSVIICRTHCVQQPELCENMNIAAARFGRMTGKQQIEEEEGDKITVDQRIRVLVLKDEEGREEEGEGRRGGGGGKEEGGGGGRQQPSLAGNGGKKEQMAMLEVEQKKRVDLAKAILDEQNGEEEEDGEEARRRLLLEEGGANNPPNFGGSFKPSNGDVCLNPLFLLLLATLLILAIAALFISLLTHWCRRKNARTNFYPTSTFSTELSSHHFHIPRILDRPYMG